LAVGLHEKEFAMEWKSMPDGKEKYNAYLCSREWSVLKEAVKERSRGVCERCNANQMDHVHHLTYIRKYRERIEDLRAMCKGCHDFTHGKSDYDPAIYGYGRIAGKFVGTFYLAGKITGTDWRDEIVRDWSQENHSPHNYEAMYEYEKSKLWAVAHRAASAGNGVMLDYVGPWWSPGAGGHSTSLWFDSPHAYVCTAYENWKNPPTPDLYNEVRANIDVALNRADLVFAWIDSTDCFGTLVELGIAAAKKKAIVVAFSDKIDAKEFWLASSYAHQVVVAKTAGEAWASVWGIATKQVEQEAKA
jgi:hypothetical protein